MMIPKKYKCTLSLKKNQMRLSINLCVNMGSLSSDLQRNKEIKLSIIQTNLKSFFLKVTNTGELNSIGRCQS